MAKKNKTARLYSAITIFSVIGILLAVYLLAEQVTHSPFTPCNISDLINCNAIISGSVSKVFGISTPLYGLLGYVVIFFASIFQKRKTVLFTALGGLLFCLWIAYQELFIIHVICPVCIACQLDMIAVFVLALIIKPRH